MSKLDFEQSRHEKDTRPNKNVRLRLPTIVETVGQTYFTPSSPGKAESTVSGRDTSKQRPAEADQEKSVTETAASMKQTALPMLADLEKMGELHVDSQLVDSTEAPYLPPVTSTSFITAPNKTSGLPSVNLTRRLSLIDRSSNHQDESHTSHDNEIVARITRTLPTSLMRKMTLNEELVTQKKRLLDNSRKFASRDLFADPRWKRLESVLKDDGNRR